MNDVRVDIVKLINLTVYCLNSISRDFHSEDIFTYMATIMTVVLEESEEVTMELLTPLLATVKKHSKVFHGLIDALILYCRIY